MEQLFNELEWLGSHLDPLEQTIILNNLDKLINDQSTPNLMERIKRGERPADIFAPSSLENGTSESSATMTQGAPRRRRRVSASAGPAGTRSAVALEASSSSSSTDAVSESEPSPGNGVVPGNSRKRCRDAEE